jgi:hypothetical protein
VNPPNANSRFEHVNLLGTDFCSLSGLIVTVDYTEKIATMRFPSRQWE